MKKIILLLSILAMSFAIAPKGIAQTNRLASFVGGQEALEDYIAKNASFPREAMDNKPINGRVYLLAEVQEDGSLDKIKVVRKLDPILDEYAIRLAQNMPKWLPALKGGKASKQIVSFCIPYQYDVTPIETEGKASFLGGDDARKKFIDRNLRYPEEMLNKGVEGRVLVQFIVQSNGDVKEPKILYSCNKGFNKEIIRFINSMPKWIPQMRGSKGVPSTVRMTINFVLDPRLKEAISEQRIQDIKRLVEELKYKKR